jgi:beta-glucosidase
VSASVRNVSSRPGSAVPELYLASPPAAGEPSRQLKGYEKVQLGPRQSAVVTFHLSRHDRAYFDPGLARWVVAPGRYTVYVGTSSEDTSDRAGFELQ